MSKPEIYYHGVYNADKDSFSGSWTFDKADPSGYGNISKHRGSGTWVMVSKKDDNL